MLFQRQHGTAAILKTSMVLPSIVRKLGNHILKKAPDSNGGKKCSQWLLCLGGRGIHTAVNGPPMGTWLIPNPSTVKYGDIVSSLPRFNSNTNGVRKTAVLLATRSFADWLQDGHQFLSEAMHHMYGETMSGSGLAIDSLQSISAVVDKLPGVRGTMGSEGISLLIQPTAMELVELSNQYLNPEYQPTVSFRENVLIEEDDTGHVTKFIELPVANTLFINGLRSIFYEDKWEFKRSGEVSINHVLRRPLRKITLALGTSIADDLIVELPLQPLTQPRRILNSMGNVIRELEGDDGKPLLASAELEKRVPECLKIHARYPPSNFTVYALLGSPDDIQGGAEKSEESVSLFNSTDILPSKIDFKQALFFKGAHLHRVTSGGGGWGKKQGLLSLDAAVSLNKDETVKDAEFDPEAIQNTPASSSPIHNGDYVQFYASLHNAQGSVLRKDQYATREYEVVQSQHYQHFCFGIIPPQDDFVGQGSADIEGDNLFTVLPNQFGMLSENGACVGVDVTKFRTRHERIDSSAEIAEDECRSRLDVPFTTLIISRKLKSTE